MHSLMRSQRYRTASSNGNSAAILMASSPHILIRCCPNAMQLAASAISNAPKMMPRKPPRYSKEHDTDPLGLVQALKMVGTHFLCRGSRFAVSFRVLTNIVRLIAFGRRSASTREDYYRERSARAGVVRPANGHCSSILLEFTSSMRETSNCDPETLTRRTKPCWKTG